MSKDKISQYSSTSAGANLNTDIAGVNIDEGCPPSGINNAIRALMAQLKDFQEGVSGDTLPIASGGTGAASAASARAALGVAIDTDVQAYDADLTTLGGLAKTDGNFIVGDGSTWVVESGSTARTSLGLGTLATLNEVNASTIADNSVGAAELNVPGNGTSGQYLASDGDGTMTWTDLPAGGGGFTNMQVFTSPGTWTNPGSVEKVKVTVVGGGGSSPNGPGNAVAGGGGGGTAIEIVSFPTGTNVSVTVGGSGGTSSFGAYCSASGGGTGGQGPATAFGGAGGSGSGGTINIVGADGGNAHYPSGNHMPDGGPSTHGGGGKGGIKVLAINGTPGNNYGGGGGGVNTTGAPGVVIVEY